jgi:hypothetical protein
MRIGDLFHRTLDIRAFQFDENQQGLIVVLQKVHEIAAFSVRKAQSPPC